jgi:hypothetical protein
LEPYVVGVCNNNKILVALGTKVVEVIQDAGDLGQMRPTRRQATVRELLVPINQGWGGVIQDGCADECLAKI